MKMLKLGGRMGLFCLLFCSSCSSGPNPADVAAERARWRATSDAVADNTVTPEERAALDALFKEWDRKLTVDEEAIAARSEKTVQEIIRIYGEAAVAVVLADPELQQKAKEAAPDMFKLADANKDGSLSLQEILAVDPSSPVFAAVVVTTAARLFAELRKKHKK